MHWLHKTRPNLHSRLVAGSMIMLRSEQDVTMSTWLTNVRLPVADCLSGRQTTIASKTRPSRYGHCLAQYCVSILQNQNRPMSLSRVLHLRIVQKDVNFKKINLKIYDLTLTYTLPLADKTSAR